MKIKTNILRRCRPGLLLAAMIFVPLPAAAQFMPGIADLPIMAGLKPDSAGPVIFDTPQGRIVVSSATGRIAEEAVLRFYSNTLPQLGWYRQSALEFTRAGENLKLEVLPLGGGRIVLKFMVAPSAGRVR
ncbi:MAG: hypothetical protein HQ503_01125 [Rhodospirillales bacterium]|nr:hypothetical protein [Rhodospirillales bacterium]